MNAGEPVSRRFMGRPKDGDGKPLTVALPLYLYGILALAYTYLSRIRFHINEFCAAHGVLLGYSLCFVILVSLGRRQWRSGRRWEAGLNFGFAALTAILGAFAYHVIVLETAKWF